MQPVEESASQITANDGNDSISGRDADIVSETDFEPEGRKDPMPRGDRHGECQCSAAGHFSPALDSCLAHRMDFRAPDSLLYDTKGGSARQDLCQGYKPAVLSGTS